MPRGGDRGGRRPKTVGDTITTTVEIRPDQNEVLRELAPNYPGKSRSAVVRAALDIALPELKKKGMRHDHST